MGKLDGRTGLLNNWKAVGRLGSRNSGFRPTGAPSPEPPPPAGAPSIQTEGGFDIQTEGGVAITEEA